MGLLIASSIHKNGELYDSVRIQYLATSLTGAARESTKFSICGRLIPNYHPVFANYLCMLDLFKRHHANAPRHIGRGAKCWHCNNFFLFLKILFSISPFSTNNFYYPVCRNSSSKIYILIYNKFKIIRFTKTYVASKRSSLAPNL